VTNIARIGTSGWSYSQWRAGIYVGTPQSKHLTRYAEYFSTVELNSSFYRLPPQTHIHGWLNKTPADFRFAVKAWRAITHDLRLKNCTKELQECAALWHQFGPKIGPILFQLPPSLARDDALLTDFIQQLPQDFHYVFEFRHPSWQAEPIFDILAAAHITLCHSHMKEWTAPRILTSDLLYIRLHGATAWFKGAYSEEFLKTLAEFIQTSTAQTAYIFFNNTMIGSTATDNALTLTKMFESPQKCPIISK
jgi:uncharacterized protein YecE (DUF72 family)